MPRFTEAEMVEVWDRWQAGDGYRLIGRDLGRSAASIRAFVESWGGVRPQPRKRSERHLSLHEREERIVSDTALTRVPEDQTFRVFVSSLASNQRRHQCWHDSPSSSKRRWQPPQSQRPRL